MLDELTKWLAVSSDANERIVRETEVLVRRIAAQFESALVEGPDPDPPAGMRLSLSCSRPNTAKVILYPSNDDIDMHLGEDTWIELLKGRRHISKRLQEVERILDAVVGGRFEESVWRVGSKIVRSKGAFYTPEGKVFLRPREWHGLVDVVPDPRQRRTRLKYRPYS
jgi:hypothetical protein